MEVGLSCTIAAVSKSGYYRWLRRVNEPESDEEDYLLIKELFDKGKGKWGWRTIQMKLKSEKKVIMNHKKIIRIKQKYGLYTKIRRINPYKAIMKKTQEHRTCENKLDRNFQERAPRAVFCTDITYLPFNHRLAYLSTVKDIGSREIVAWYVSMHIDMDVVLETVEKLKNNKAISSLDGILIHSDQGAHYTSPEYIRRIKELNMVQSMSRKGACIDNAPMESFFGHFKDDVDYKKCKTFDELKAVTAEYINYYNNERQQWHLKKMTPVQYRNHLLTTPK